jgi:CRP/FNR family transcriptional regulator, cyclic AMP receptor protein
VITPPEVRTSWAYGTFLARLDGVTRADLLDLGTARLAGPGEVLLRQGDRESHVVLLRDGFVKVTVGTAEGREALLGIRMGGDILGEMSALNGRPRSATVTTCTPAYVSTIGQDQLRKFLLRRPDGALVLAGVVADRLRWANQFRVDFTTCPVRVRLARVLAKTALAYGRRTPDGLVVGVDLTQMELASLCGAAEVTVQKVLRTFRRAGLIATGYRHLTIVDIAGLRREAELDGDG